MGLRIPGVGGAGPLRDVGRAGTRSIQHRVLQDSPVEARVDGGFPKLGVLFWGPHNKDYSILGSILGYPNFGKLPYQQVYAGCRPKNLEILQVLRFLD